MTNDLDVLLERQYVCQKTISDSFNGVTGCSDCPERSGCSILEGVTTLQGNSLTIALTDGHAVFETRTVDNIGELERLDAEAKTCSDGELRWARN